MPRSEAQHTGLAISVKQPFADHIVYGLKKREFRSFATRVRGVVWVYATKAPMPERHKIQPLGLIVGEVEIADVKLTEDGFAWIFKNPRAFEPPKIFEGRPAPCFWRPRKIW
jgi:hypothetical protein